MVHLRSSELSPCVLIHLVEAERAVEAVVVPMESSVAGSIGISIGILLIVIIAALLIWMIIIFMKMFVISVMSFLVSLFTLA